MTSFAFTDATIWVAGYDFTGDSNQMQLGITADELDCTTFGSGGFRKRTAGLRNTTLQVGGYWQSDTSAAVDPQVFPNLGIADRVVTVAPTADEGTPAYFFQGVKLSYQAFGSIGEVTPFQLGASGSNGVGTVRGAVAKAKGTVSATGATGTVQELGEVSSEQHLYATLHVFSAGTTLTAVVESAADDDEDFEEATTRITFSSLTSAGGTWGTRAAGAITDTLYRLRVSAITGSFVIACAIGIR